MAHVKLDKPELKFQRWSPAGVRPTRYKALIREDSDEPFRLLCWVVGLHGEWTVPGELVGLGGQTFDSRQAAAEAALVLRGDPS